MLKGAAGFWDISWGYYGSRSMWPFQVAQGTCPVYEFAMLPREGRPKPAAGTYARPSPEGGYVCGLPCLVQRFPIYPH